MGNRIVTHLCVGINRVLELPQNANTPYYNAFAFMVSVNGWDMFKKAVEPYSTEIQNPAPVSDRRLAEIENAVYKYFADSDEFKAIVWNEYKSKKALLNFEIID